MKTTASPLPANRRRTSHRNTIKPELRQWIETLLSTFFENPTLVQTHLQSITKALEKTSTPYEDFQRPWILKLVFQHIHSWRTKHENRIQRLEYAYKMEILTPSQRISEIRTILKRLPISDQFHILLKEYLNIEDNDISIALQIPVASLKSRRLQAFRAVEEWIWNISGKTPQSCYFFSNLMLDYIEQNLSQEVLKSAKNHFESCTHCSQHVEHFQKIKSAIAASNTQSEAEAPPRTTPPKPALLSREKWQGAPWYVRTGGEALAIGILVFTVVVLGPKVRTFSERVLERRLESYEIPELASGESQSLDGTETDESTPENAEDGERSNEFQEYAVFEPLSELGQSPSSSSAPIQEPAIRLKLKSEIDFNIPSLDQELTTGESITAVTPSEPAAPTVAPPKVGSSEIWRFYIKTDSPQDLRPQIQKILEALKIPPQLSSVDQKQVAGVEAPGGIQFNFLAPSETVPNLMIKMQELAHHLSVPDSPLKQTRETFTWYKNKSKKPIPAGRSRVVIWLSQI